MAEKRNPEFSILLRFRGKAGAKIEFFCAGLWPKQGGKPGLYRLKIGTPLEGRPGAFSETWHPGPRKYVFMTEAEAWGLVASQAGHDADEGPATPTVPVGTPVRVPNGNFLDGQAMFDVTRTATVPVRLSDGRDYVVVNMIGRGAIHVPVDDIEIYRR
jgi:hypothetical protein